MQSLLCVLVLSMPVAPSGHLQRLFLSSVRNDISFPQQLTWEHLEGRILQLTAKDDGTDAAGPIARLRGPFGSGNDDFDLVALTRSFSGHY